MIALLPRFHRLALGLISAIFAGQALALNLGNLSIQSKVGEPLQAQISIQVDPSELSSIKDIQAALASPEMYQRLGITSSAAQAQLKVTVLKGSKEEPVAIKITSDEVLKLATNEIFLDALVEVRWSAGLVRRVYTLMVADQASVEVKAGDTLTEIASKLVANFDEASLDQTLISLYRANPQAFAGGSIHRLMAGAELVTEGFKPGQVGSSAMPHKMNTRSCERVNGLAVVLRGYASMISELSGNQWNEGDVSCSVVRRVAIADSFYAFDGLMETILTVLNEFGTFPALIEAELERQLPFLATTKILMAAVKAGVGREVAHEVIKEHSVKATIAIREGKANTFFADLAADSRIPLNRAALDQLVGKPIEFAGDAQQQVARVVNRVNVITSEFKEASKYTAQSIR